MRVSFLFLYLWMALSLQANPLLKCATSIDSIDIRTASMQPYEGYFDFWWDAKEGKIWLAIDRFEEEFLYVNSLP
ncbi:MAG: hypothetical protein AAF990_25225, partial [Bacteroidota bacterium]